MLELLEIDGSGAPQSWGDGKRAPLEEKLGHVVAGIETAAEIEVDRQRRWAREREELEREWQRREEGRRQAAVEAKAISTGSMRSVGPIIPVNSYSE